MKTILVLATFILGIQSYCWEPGKHPSFNGPPTVRQVSPDQVEVNWGDQIVLRECADNFLVKYWMRNRPALYETSPLVGQEANSIIVRVQPGVLYDFQAVAREEKGPVGGVDWNKSPVVEFKTSRTSATTSSGIATGEEIMIQATVVAGLLAICVLGNI